MTGFAAVPLAEDGGDHDDSAHLAGVARILGPRWLQLPAITIGLLGVQVFWSIEMSYGNPYLRSLGLSKSAVATVFLAGPVSGLVVQPLIGVLADNCKSRFGRRRPYMLGGVCICVVAMLLLGFTRPFATLFTPSESSANNILTITLAILALFSIDFSINAVQAVDRALLVDTLSPSDQAEGNAWAARMLGIGSVAGYFIGNVDLTVPFSFLGDTELEVLSLLGSFLLITMQLVTATCTKERVVVATKGSKSFHKELIDIWDNMRHLPSIIRQICIIQFFAWLGWFPVLFYTTAFVGEIHKRAHPTIPQDDPALNAEATRLGSRAMFYSSLLSLTCNLLLPFIVSEAKDSRAALERRLRERQWGAWKTWFERVKVHLATLWAVSHVVFAVCMGATFFYTSVWGATFFTMLTGFSWSITQWAPFSLLAEAILTEDNPADDTSSIMLADTRTQLRSLDHSLGLADERERQFLVGDDEDTDMGGEDHLEVEVRSFTSSASMDEHDQERRDGFMAMPSARMSHLDVPNSIHQRSSSVEREAEKDRHGGGLASKAGIIIGIHNIFIVMPQFIMTAIASIIFAILEPGKSALGGAHDGVEMGNSTVSRSLGAPATSSAVAGAASTHALLRAREDVSGPNSYAIVFRLGGVAAAVAFVLTVRLARELRQR